MFSESDLFVLFHDRMGYKIDKNVMTLGPAPCAYNVTNYDVGKNSQKWGFSTDKRQERQKRNFNPGPGNYNLRSMAFSYEKPRFHMGTKLSPLKSKHCPGAGTY
jgi:hypothetical protein